MKLELFAQRLLATIAISLAILFSPVNAASIVEVPLIDKLDEPRGFCLDIVGSQQKANPSRGLQAHTCYSYQGKIAVDQGFDAVGIKSGAFRLPRFEVCMTSTGQTGSPPMLQPCDGTAQQHFRLNSAGRIVPQSETSLCVSVSEAPSVPGARGTPPHLIRRLTLQSCDSRLDRYQKWRIREKFD